MTLKQFKHSSKVRIWILLGLALVMVCVLQSCSNKNSKDKQEPTSTPTISQAPILSPTSMPTATPAEVMPIKRWIPLNQEKTIYQLPVDQRSSESGSIGHIYGWKDDLLVVSSVKGNIYFYVCDVFSGVVKANLTIPGNYLDLDNAQITDDMEYRYFDSASKEFIYISQELEIVDRVKLDVNDQFRGDGYLKTIPFITEDKKDVYYLRYLDTDEIELVWKNLETGKETVMKEELKNSNYGNIKSLLFEDHMLLMNVYGEVTGYYYIDLDKFQIHKQDNSGYIELTSQENVYGGMVSNSLPELIFGFSQTMEETKSIAYKNQSECYNGTYFLDERFLSTYYTVFSKDNQFVNYFYRIYDLQSGHLSKITKCLDLKFNIYLDKPRVYLKDLNLLVGIGYQQNQGFLYIWDLDATGNEADMETSYILPYFDNNNPDYVELERLQARADEIGNKYGVRILTGANCRTDLFDYAAKPIYEVRLIEQTLQQLDSVLDQYPDDFFEQIGDYGKDSLVIYLIGELTNQGENTISDAAAVYNGYNEEQYVAIDCTQYMSLKQTLYHEFSHAIDRFLRIHGDGYNYEYDWNKLNPEGFQYEYSYSDENDISSDFCHWNDEPMDTYFIDTYAKTYQTEDRARLMEYVLMDGIAAYQEYPHIMKKLKVMYYEIYTTFDTTSWKKDFFQFDNFFGIPE